MSRPIFATSVESADALGLDPSLFTVSVAVHRLDGEAMSAEELALAKAALAKVAKPKPEASPVAPAYPPQMAEVHAIATDTKATGTGGE